MSPYRSLPKLKHTTKLHDTGIISDVINQFSDSFAFLRELVQNAIDAETEEVVVCIHYDSFGSSLIVEVQDEGVGMSRDTIESQLLVLFRSSKESQPEKIGKFGIGFMSVLALNPTVVKVQTTHQGTCHQLHLSPDLSFELFASKQKLDSGTVITLEIPMSSDEVQSFAQQSYDALKYWCRHASVPIHFEASDASGQAFLQERIDRPLDLPDALISVHRISKDGKTEVVVGLQERATASFFNHGLLLHSKAQSHLAWPLSFAVQDSRLGHTLSRDDVRKDSHFDTALHFVRQVAEADFQQACSEALRSALQARDFSTYRQQTAALHTLAIPVVPERWYVPVIATPTSSGIATIADVKESGSWATHSNSKLAQVMAQSGSYVLDQSNLDSSREVTWLGMPELRHIEYGLTLVTPIATSSTDLLLLEHTSDALAQCIRRPSSIVLAQLHGARSNQICTSGASIYGSQPGDNHLVLDSENRPNPFRVLRKPTLFLNTQSSALVAARARAQTSPRSAAALLSRLILLRYDRLDTARSEQILSNSLTLIAKGQS